MDPSGIQRGYMTFTPVDPSVKFGYIYQNQFFEGQGNDQYYIQTLGAIPAINTWTGFYPLPPGATQMYCYQGMYFQNYSQMESYFNYLQYGTTIQSYPRQEMYSQPTPEVVIPAPEMPKLEPNPDVLVPNPVILEEEKKKPEEEKKKPEVEKKKPEEEKKEVRKNCVICGVSSPRWLSLVGKNCCLLCLRMKYIKKEMYFDDKTGRTNWTEGMIYDVHMKLHSSLSEGEKNGLPTEIQLPCDHAVCIGCDRPVAPGYPAKGHIIGNDSICAEDACPNKAHILCKGCALKALKCPECGEKITYEDNPPCPPECPNHNATFIKACEICGKVNPRIKFGKPVDEPKAEEPPVDEPKAEEPKAEEAKAEDKKE